MTKQIRAARKVVLRGFARLLDLNVQLDADWRHWVIQESTFEALSRDWAAVGNDLRAALHRAEFDAKRAPQTSRPRVERSA